MTSNDGLVIISLTQVSTSPMCWCTPFLFQSKISIRSGRSTSPLQSFLSCICDSLNLGLRSSMTTSDLHTVVHERSPLTRLTARNGSDFPNIPSLFLRPNPFTRSASLSSSSETFSALTIIRPPVFRSLQQQFQYDPIICPRVTRAVPKKSCFRRSSDPLTSSSKTSRTISCTSPKWYSTRKLVTNSGSAQSLTTSVRPNSVGVAADAVGRLLPRPCPNGTVSGAQSPNTTKASVFESKSILRRPRQLRKISIVW
mmetsp:Transcript_49717/g.97236  ORF Transcript_49717/g.97236 Transcript_49717/m.97236 type:complete len:255 (-) Transcript_49717:171-935(-)